MKIARSPDFLESVANDPRVFPAVSCAGMERVDLAPVWGDCIGLEFDTGGWLFHRLRPAYYEVHTLFLPRSRYVREMALAAAHYMFTGTDAMELVTKVPVDLPSALALAKASGFTERFTRKGAWIRDSGAVDVVYLGLTLDEWARGVGREYLAERGEWFHQQLGEHQTHDDDPIHDLFVGLGIACAEAGQADKGLWLYNRWAAFAGYRPLEMKRGAIRFDGVVLRVSGENVTVEKEQCP
ncbi:hypothetical protein ACI2IY_05660 [Lysobacter enzymogenes]|uniref:hypothetical protein n=1 Tax=Lysobacter enzymogenes TaxID=69 RepID=UPI003851291F